MAPELFAFHFAAQTWLPHGGGEEPSPTKEFHRQQAQGLVKILCCLFVLFEAGIASCGSSAYLLQTTCVLARSQSEC